jgi:hypothetical protein
LFVVPCLLFLLSLSCSTPVVRAGEDGTMDLPGPWPTSPSPYDDVPSLNGTAVARNKKGAAGRGSGEQGKDEGRGDDDDDDDDWEVVCNHSSMRCVSSFLQGVACGTDFLMPRVVKCRGPTENEALEEERERAHRGHDHARDDGAFSDESGVSERERLARMRAAAKNGLVQKRWVCRIKERWVHSVRIDEASKSCTIDQTDTVTYFLLWSAVILGVALFAVSIVVSSRCITVAISTGRNAPFGQGHGYAQPGGHTTNLYIAPGASVEALQVGSFRRGLSTRGGVGGKHSPPSSSSLEPPYNKGAKHRA